ncbi:MAG: hypothetical protein DHS20C17_17270 [Cyclobacteriaceae bacterium]|nr:MAG: hypothetical protein DHS20C17_17270 [Cyclobacteriaceae bacterium]
MSNTLQTSLIGNFLIKQTAFVITILGLTSVIFSCQNDQPEARSNNTWPLSITVEGERFVDNWGREVILNGINVVNKSKEDGYMFEGGPDFYANLKKWGFNSIRFVIIWDGLEPEPGVYDEEYLKKIDQRINWAADQGLFVILDMHQDLFSVKYSDGAPEWATLDEGKPHLTGAIWSDAYMLSEAVQTSFDNFWANKPAVDGIGVQDHYANLWRHLAERYKDNKAVIGFDLMNEPFPGSVAQQATPALLNQYGKLVYQVTGKVLTAEELENTWANEESRMEALELLESKEAYTQVMDTLYHLNQEFEVSYLQPMYQKVADAIREVNSRQVIFLEHSYYSNTGVKSSIRRVTLADRTPDPLVAYAPHAYDLVTDTKAAASSSNQRVAAIFERIKEKSAQLKMPVWLGEWGAYYTHSEGIDAVARNAVSLIERYLMGHAYWSYDPGTEKLEYFQKALLRPYPAYTSGSLKSYHIDFKTGVFEMNWQQSMNIKEPTVIYIPWTSRLNKARLADYQGAYFEKIANSEAGWVIVPASITEGDRQVVLQFQ